MEQEQKEATRVRKTYAKNGERSQKMMAFRCDNDLLEWLTSQSNKGRYINDLIRADMKEAAKTNEQEKTKEH